MDFVFFDEFLLKDLLIAHDLNGPKGINGTRCFDSQVCIRAKTFFTDQSESVRVLWMWMGGWHIEKRGGLRMDFS